MTFFYDLNKKLDSIRAKPELTHGQLNEGKKPDFLDLDKDGDKKEPMKKAVADKKTGPKKGVNPFAKKEAVEEGRDEGKPGKNFAKIAKSAGKHYGSKAAGERVAGAVRNKLKKADKLEESSNNLDQMLSHLGKDVDTFKQTGELTDALYDVLYDYYFDDMPYGTKKARDGDPYEWISDRLHQDLGMSEGVDKQAFAALAPPTDKITFADKIAGAKKEVDEMLGDVAAEAMKGAIGRMGANSHQAKTTMKHIPNAGPALKKAAKDIKPGIAGYRDRADMLRAGGIDEDEDNNPFTSWKKARADRPRVGDVEHGSKHDIKHTATGRIVTRRTDPNTGHSVGADDDTPASGEKRGRGRPAGKGAGKSIGAKGPSGKSKLMTREGSDYGQAQQIYDELADIRATAKQAQRGGEFPQGFASRLESVLYAAMTLIKNQQSGGAQVSEDEPTTKKDNHAEKAGRKVAKDIEYDEKKKDGIHGSKRGAEDDKAERAGKKVAKDIEYDEKKSKKKEVDETTVSGSIAVGGEAPSDPGKPKKQKAAGGSMQFGKGVYEAKISESFNRKLSTMLTEGISITANQSEDGKKSLTVNATDEDAIKLAQMLQLAGMPQGNSQYEEACSQCGQSPCGCEHDEMMGEEYSNSPNAQVSDTDTMINKLSGGLNGRKTTGQTTAPVVNRDPRRGSLGAIAENQESKLWELYNRYSTK